MLTQYIIAERLSARQLIAQCGLKSQLAYIYIYCSRVAAIAGPWNCVVYGDIRLLKAHSCRVAFLTIAWAM